MRESYIDVETRSIISLYKLTLPCNGWVICRVSVLAPHRGQGLARMLMNQVLVDADKDWKILYLSVQPDGSPGTLNEKQLTAFYVRCGFNKIRYWNGLNMVRFPDIDNRG